LFLKLFLREIKSEKTLEWVAINLASGRLALFTETPDVIELAIRIVERSRTISSLRGVDIPEAICLALGKLRGYIVLTENRGALMAADVLEELSGVIVWRSLEVIREAIRRRIIVCDPEQFLSFMRRKQDIGFQDQNLRLLFVSLEKKLEKWHRLEEEAREIRRREADWKFIESQPPRVRAALIYYIETGDIRTSAKLAGMDLEDFRELLRKANIPVVT
jgi:hypothetical protein